jgi:hypothetical protein
MQIVPDFAVRLIVLVAEPVPTPVQARFTVMAAGKPVVASATTLIDCNGLAG